MITINEIDEKARIAKMLCAYRLLKGKTLKNMYGTGLGLTFQQGQKYENMLNAISAHKLMFLCRRENYDFKTISTGNPNDLVQKLDEKQKLRAFHKFAEIERLKEEEQQAYYNAILPKIHLEMTYKDTFGK